MKKALFSGVLAALALGCVAAQAAEMTVSFATDKPPFSFKDGSGANVGIEVDVVRAVLQKMGHTVKPMIVPNARLTASLNEGAAIAAAVQGKDGGGLFYSSDFVEYVNVAISKTDKAAKISSFKDLDNYNFVIWQKGWADLGPEFEAKYKPDDKGNFRPNYNQAANQRAQNLMFWSGRADVVVVDKTIFEYYKNELKKEAKTDVPVTFHDIFKSKTGFPVVTKDKALRDQFNDALKAIRADGTYDKILAKYK